MNRTSQWTHITPSWYKTCECVATCSSKALSIHSTSSSTASYAVGGLHGDPDRASSCASRRNPSRQTLPYASIAPPRSSESCLDVSCAHTTVTGECKR